MRRDPRQQYRVTVPGQDEKIGWSYWDRQPYVDNVTTRLTYFTTPRNNKRDGNLPLGAQLSARESFICRSIRVVPIVRPNEQVNFAAAGIGESLADDLAQIYNDGVLSVAVLDKPYGEWPLFMLLPGTGIVADVAAIALAGNASNLFQNVRVGNPDNRAVYTLATPLNFPSQSAIGVTIDWVTAVNTISGNIDLQVVLDGHKVRPAQ